jgi:penicillin-binding protein 2
MVYDEKLRGNYGYNMLIMSSSKGSTQMVEKTHPISGNNIVLSLDLDLQIKAYNYMKDTNHNGVVIISDPNTGEILVFVSYPSPDPNMFSEGMNSLDYRKILNDQNKILVNRGVSSYYPPGSIIKPFVAYAALEAGISPYATINSTGIYYLKNANGVIIDQLEDWNHTGHGETDLVKSIRASVNSYYYWLGENLGIDYIEEYAHKFKLVDPTLIDIPFEKKGNFPGRKWKLDNFGEVWYPGETLRVYIGQSATTMTPIQILRMYNLFATGGDYYKFNFFMKEEDLFGNVVNEYEPILVDDYEMNKEYLEYIYQGMIEVTTYDGPTYEQGTAYPAFKDFPITVAGKTGTAQIDKEKQSHSWFAGFLPANNPQYSIVVFIEYGGMGSTAAAPVAREILDDLVRKYF